MIARDKDEWHTCSFSYFSSGVKKDYMLAVIIAISFILIHVAETKDDACFWHEIRGPFCSESNLLRSILAHRNNVIHDSFEVLGTGAIMSTTLIDMAVADENTAEPNVLNKAESISTIVVSEYFQFIIIDCRGRRIRRDFCRADLLSIHLYTCNEVGKYCPSWQCHRCKTFAVAFGNVRKGCSSERERHLSSCYEWAHKRDNEQQNAHHWQKCLLMHS